MGQDSKIYANVLACYNEGKLLGEEKLRRLKDADFRDAVKILADYGYGGGGLNDHSYDVDIFITQETAKLITFIEDECASVQLKNCLLNEFFYSDAKILYKSKFVEVDKSISLYGVFEVLNKAIETSEYSELPVFMAEALRGLDARYENSAPDSKEIDIALTKAMHADNIYNAKKSRDKRLIEYVRTKADFSNILTAFRLKKLLYKEEAFSLEFIEGGYLSYDALSKVFSSGEETLSQDFEDTKYAELIDKLITSGDFVDFERDTDATLYNLLAGSSFDMLSLSPFINYFMAQMSEFKFVKIILVCLKNNARDELNRRIARNNND